MSEPVFLGLSLPSFVQVKHPDLKELLPFGFAIHHAGLARNDRTLVEVRGIEI